MRSLHYDRVGNPISMKEWVFLHGKEDYRRVAWDDLGKLGTVSTVWLGLDHSFMSERPVIFETMVFGGELDAYQERYSTEEEARIGHEFMVMAVQMLNRPKTRPLIHNGKKPH